MRNLLLLAFTSSVLLAACGGGDTGGSPQPVADTLAPAVSLNAVQNGTTVNLTASASDSSGVSKVEFYRNGTLIGTDTTAPYEWADSVSSADNGTLNYSARAADAVGNIGTGAAQLTLNITTLYQGVWGWAIADTSGNLVDSGAAVFYDEDTYQDRTAAFGTFANITKTPAGNPTKSGFSLMGPISAVGQLETGFFLGNPTDAAVNPYFIGIDSDNTMGTYQGSATFSGTGSTFVNGQESQAVYVALVQSSNIVPQGLALDSAKAAARATAERLVTLSQPSPLKADAAQVKAVADNFLKNR